MDKFWFNSGLFCAVIISCLCLNDAKQKMTQEGLKVMEDASEVTWAHAVNSRAALSKELAGNVDFLEADVSMGYLDITPQGAPMPIMVHPPEILSDISLEEWLDAVIAADSGKGVKLDFKSLDVVEASLRILQVRTSELNFTLWLNADILSGPINPTSLPVKEDTFLMLCNKYFPSAVLSIGWTTNFVPSHSKRWRYEWKHVRKMADAIKCFSHGNYLPTITFPVRGIYASRSIKKLQWLLGVIRGSSLTVWSHQKDPLQLQDLIRIRTHFPKNKVFYDIPEPLQSAFLKAKHGVDAQIHLQRQKDDQWLTLTRGSDHTCTSNTYVSNNTILFGKSLTTAVLHKKLLFADGSQSLKVTGKVCFFGDYEQQMSHNIELSIVITDVSLFSKNSSTNQESNLSLAASDTNVLWEAINGSHYHTFKHDLQDEFTSCQIFKMDISQEKCFQTWMLSVEEAEDDISQIQDNIPVNLDENKMALPTGPFMLGFVFSGDGHAVVYDFEIEGKKQNISGGKAASGVSLKFVGLICFSVIVGYFTRKCFD